MKKTILTAMLFFALLVAGVQNVNAQYVPVDDATNLLSTEVQAILANPDYSNVTEKDAQFIYLKNKLEFYSFVKNRIATGETVSRAIELGVLTTNTTLNPTANSFAVAVPSGKEALPPLHQEIIDLLSN